jgi:hypothetical protein
MSDTPRTDMFVALSRVFCDSDQLCAFKDFSAGLERENAELKRLVEQMTEALALANKEHPCPRKHDWQSVATTHHSGKCWHSKMEAALEAAKGEKG